MPFEGDEQNRGSRNEGEPPHHAENAHVNESMSDTNKVTNEPPNGTDNDGVPTDDLTRSRVTYDGTGSDLLVVFIKNILLILATFGFYASWAKVRVRKYLLSHTALNDYRFVYHGTGGELFWGAFKVGLLYALERIVFRFIRAFVPTALPVVSVLFLVVIFLFVPYALYSTRRYRLSRFSWRGTRFSFRGSVAECYRLYFTTP